MLLAVFDSGWYSYGDTTFFYLTEYIYTCVYTCVCVCVYTCVGVCIYTPTRRLAKWL